MVKLAPVIRTFVPGLPNVGEKLNTVGSTMKLLPDVWADPAGAPTLMMPVTALVGTETRIAPLLSTLKSVANTPPNCTDNAPRKFVPVTTTLVPVRPVMGE